MSSGKKLERKELLGRLIQFAIDTSELSMRLPDNSYARYIGSQLARSGTSPALNYAEAMGAESIKDLVHKQKIALKELRESAVALKIINAKYSAVQTRSSSLIIECDELISIFVKGCKALELKLK